MINITMSDNAAPLLNEMKRVLGAKDHVEVIQQCLLLMQAAINAQGQGLQTGFINEEGAVIPIFNPVPQVMDLKAEKIDEHAPDSPKTE